MRLETHGFPFPPSLSAALGEEESAVPENGPVPKQETEEAAPQGDGEATVVVVTKGGMASSDENSPSPTDMVEEPAKVMRIGSMIKQLLEEVREAPLDEAGRVRLAEVHRRSIAELKDGLSPDLVEELQRITLPFSEATAPSDAELRIAQAQLVGWLEGLFHGIQTALFAQQMAAQNQLQQMRRALPPGMQPGQEGDPARGQGTGQYL